MTHPLECLQSQTLTRPNASRGVEQRELWWGCKTVHSLWKTIWWFCTKFNRRYMPYEAIMLLGIYPNELKIYVYLITYTQMFIAALFIIAKTWKQPTCTLVGEWINCCTARQWSIPQH